MGLNLEPADGRPGQGRSILAPYDAAGRRQHLLANGQDALYETTNNCDTKNPTYNPQGLIWAAAKVKDSAVARQLGLVPGRTFRLTSDLVGFYTNNNVGDVQLDDRSAVAGRLEFVFSPVMWIGRSRDDQDRTVIPSGGLLSQTFTLEINIAAK